MGRDTPFYKLIIRARALSDFSHRLFYCPSILTPAVPKYNGQPKKYEIYTTNGNAYTKSAIAIDKLSC